MCNAKEVFWTSRTYWGELSVFDGLGKSKEHFDFILKNGGDGMAITEHGHANSFAEAYKYSQELKKKGRDFKYIPGVEFYLYPDLGEWEKLKLNLAEEKKNQKESPIADDDEGTTITVEDESTTKSQKWRNPLRRRHHTVILPKNNEGLEALFSLVSFGYSEGQYYFPRIDFHQLAKKAKGNLIATTACLGGPMAYEMFDACADIDADDITPDIVKSREGIIMPRIMNVIDKFVESVGEENFFLELQFNKIPCQHAINYLLMRAAEQTGIKLISTADSHYPGYDKWKARELYRRLRPGKGYDDDPLPQSVEDLKCELFPKNAEQMWDEYLVHRDKYDFYQGKDEIIKDAIERSHEVAHEMIEEIDPDKKVKLPSYTVPKGEKPMQALARLCVEGLKEKGLDNNKEYVDRLKEELQMIKDKKFAKYFLTMKAITDIAHEHMLVGFGRGCLTGNSKVLTSNGYKNLSDISVGEQIYDVNGKKSTVIKTSSYDVNEDLLEFKTSYSYDKITLTKDHKLCGSKSILVDGYDSWSEITKKSRKKYKTFTPQKTWMKAEEFDIGDWLYMPFPKKEEPKIADDYKFDLQSLSKDLNQTCEGFFFEPSISKNNIFSIRNLNKETGISRGSLKFIRSGIVPKKKNKRHEKCVEKLNQFLKNNDCTIENWKLKKDLKKISSYIPFDNDFAYLVGRWIGDGWIIKGNRNYKFGIAFHSDDRSGIEKIKNYLMKFGFRPKELHSKEKKLTQLIVYNQTIVKFFDYLFPKYKQSSCTKYIPELFFGFSNEKISNLLDGIIDSDGHRASDGRISIDSTSNQLILDLKRALLYLKIPSSIVAREEFLREKYICKKSYKIRFQINRSMKESHNIRFVDEGYFVKILSKELKKNVNTKVYDLSIGDGHSSYCTSNYVVHNSAAGSLVCYVLDITGIDPIKYGLLFSRFLSKNRSELPDIDSDFSDRDRLRKILMKEFGEENVIAISNINTMSLKTLAKDISKFYGIEYAEVNDAVRFVDKDIVAGGKKEDPPIDKTELKFNFEEAMKYSLKFADFIEKYPKVGEHIQELMGEQRAMSRHAGGIILSENIVDRMPVIVSKNVKQTPWTKDYLEPLGWVKFDLLGLETLKIIEMCISLILQRHEGVPNPTFADIKKWYKDHLHPNVIDLDDQKVYEHIYHNGNYAGIFQCSQRDTQRFFTEAKPTSVVDIAALTSIYRPGPMGANVHKKYVDSKNNPKKVTYKHPLIKQVLEETYGHLVFQEQAMKLGNVVGGMNLDETDVLRKVVSKKYKPEDPMYAKAIAMEKVFIEGGLTNKLSEDVLIELYQNIKEFAKYSFNLSHALSYGINSYLCAWLLTYYEPEWLCAYVETQLNNPKEKANAISELKSFGYDFAKIDINKATDHWTIVEGDKKLMPSLLSCKDVGKTSIAELIQKRPYDDIYGFLWEESGEWRHSKFNKKNFDVLIKINAFDSLDCVGENKLFKNYAHMHKTIIGNWTLLKKKLKKDTFDSQCQKLDDLAAETDDSDWDLNEKLEMYKELMGQTNLDLIIPKNIQKKLLSKGYNSIDAFPDDKEGALCWFVVEDWIKRKTKYGKPYIILNVSGLSGRQDSIKIWDWDESVKFSKNTGYRAFVEQDNFGFKLKVRHIFEISK